MHGWSTDCKTVVCTDSDMAQRGTLHCTAQNTVQYGMAHCTADIQTLCGSARTASVQTPRWLELMQNGERGLER